MSETDRSPTGERETGLWTSVSLLALLVFFLGCACFTMAEILLGSNDSLSAIFAVIGVPLFAVGGVVLVLRCRLGEPPGPAASASS